MSDQQVSAIGRVPTLDGWRALAVLGVILYHGRFEFFEAYSIPMKISSRGEIGVELFFAISGFLICGMLLEELRRAGRIDLRRFYIRRSFRILPAYYVVLTATVLLSLFGVIHANLANLPSCFLWYRNYRPLGIDAYGGYYTAHFWSLAVEEHFYLIWPMLLLAAKPKHAGKVAISLALTVLSWRILEGHFQFFPSLLPPANLLARTDTRMDALLWGCLAAIYLPAIKRFVERIPFPQLWLPIAAVIAVADTFRFPGLVLLHTILLPALVLSTVLQPASWLSRCLEWQPLRWLGGISYSLYLWQELFLPQHNELMAKGLFAHLQQWPANVVAIVIVACLSRYLVEIPMKELGHRLSAPRRTPASPIRVLRPDSRVA